MAIPKMDFGKAFGIVILTYAVNAGFGYLALLTESLSELLVLLTLLSLIPISFLVTAGLVAAILPTTFVRGILVALCNLLVTLIVVLVLGGIIYMFVLATHA